LGALLGQADGLKVVTEILHVMNSIDHPPDPRSGFMSKLGIAHLARNNPLDRVKRDDPST
jgi:hypothetical protein